MSSATGNLETGGVGALSVERFDGRYLVPADHPDPERVRSRLDDAVPPTLRGLASALGSQATDMQGVWLVRRLEIELEVDLSWDRDRLARLWATRLVRRLVDDMLGGGEGPDLLRFPNRAAYLARFLRDLV